MTGKAGRPAASWRTLILFLLFLAVLPVAYAWPLGLAGIVGAAGLLTAPTLRPRPAWLALPLLALVVWAGVSLLWSRAAPDWSAIQEVADLETLTPVKLVIQLALFTALALAADLLQPKAARLCMGMLAFTIAMLTVATFAEGLTGAGFYQWIRVALDDPIRPDLAAKNVAQATYVATVLFWPAALALLRFSERSALLVGALALLITMAALMFGAFAPAAAMFASVAAYALVSAAPRIGGAICAAGAALFTVVAPFLLSAVTLPPGIPESWAARLSIYTYAADRVVERPWLGWGLDASRAFGTAVPLHPHDAALQLWLELGLVGALIGAAFWALLFRAAGRAAHGDSPVGGAWAAAATAYFVIGALSFGVWQEWWLATGALAVAACLALRRGWPRSRPKEALAPLQPL